MISATPVQRRLPINVAIIAPLKTVDAARSDLETDEDDIIHLIRDKQLLAFDLRSEGAQRSEIRIYPPCVDAVRMYRKGQISEADVRQLADIPETSEADVRLGKIISQIISSNRHNVPLSMLRRRLVVSSKHVHSLIEQHQLQPVAGTGNRVNQAPMIVRASIVEFLKQRRIGHLS